MTGPARSHRWLAGPLPADVEASLDRLACADDVVQVAVMPDVHLGTEVCIGTVVATTRLIYPGAIGGDIGCGMAAIRLRDPTGDRPATIVQREAAAVLRGLYRVVPAIKHPGPARPERLPEALRERPLSAAALETFKRRDGAVQLGSLGSGNHFVELQVDDDGDRWLMLHSGSRGVGQAVLRHHLAATISARGRPALVADSPTGQAYLADLAWTLAYAEANRAELLDRATEVIADALGLEPDRSSIVTCHHNHIRNEVHGGRALWVHRKGAISAQLDEPGIIPGSMGTVSYHVAGRGHPDALCSSSHGAGRALPRSEARRRISARALEAEMSGVWFDVRHADALRDEAPSAYKDLGSVMRAQRELTRIVRRVRPLLSYKGT